MSRIETLATGAWIRDAEVILMQGPPAVGKSHLLCGLGIRDRHPRPPAPPVARSQHHVGRSYRLRDLEEALKG